MFASARGWTRSARYYGWQQLMIYKNVFGLSPLYTRKRLLCRHALIYQREDLYCIALMLTTLAVVRVHWLPGRHLAFLARPEVGDLARIITVNV